jgi:hypothetical protein
VSAVNWPENHKATVMMDHFPMDQMPPFAKDKFLGDLKAGIDSAKTAHHVTAPIEVDIVDAQSGRVMQSVTQVAERKRKPAKPPRKHSRNQMRAVAPYYEVGWERKAWIHRPRSDSRKSDRFRPSC